MSDTREGETTNIGDSFYLLQDRLNHLLRATQRSSDIHAISRGKKIANCKDFLVNWQKDIQSRSRDGSRDAPAMSHDESLRTQRQLAAAHDMCSHCEYELRITFPGAPPLKKPITEDNFRHDCFQRLEKEVIKIQQVWQPNGIDDPSLSTSRLSTPPESSPPAVLPSPAPTRESPTYLGPHPNNNDRQVPIKQEQQADTDMQSASPDASHYRKDSQYSIQSPQNEHHLQKLPGIASFSMRPEPFTQIPESTPYAPIMRRHSPMHNSPNNDAISSPLSHCQTEPINGNEEHIVMTMGSPTPMITPLHPPFSFNSVPTSFTSIFPDRPSSRPNGSSSDY